MSVKHLRTGFSYQIYTNYQKCDFAQFILGIVFNKTYNFIIIYRCRYIFNTAECVIIVSTMFSAFSFRWYFVFNFEYISQSLYSYVYEHTHSYSNKIVILIRFHFVLHNITIAVSMKLHVPVLRAYLCT